MKKIIFLILLFINLSIVLKAQNDKMIDIIYMEDGSVFKGEIIEYSDKILKLKLRGSGNIITLYSTDVKDVKVIEQKSKYLTLNSTEQKEYAFREKGFSHILAINSMYELLKEEDKVWNTRSLGFGVNYSLAYRINRLIVPTFNVGIDTYENEDFGIIIPISIGLRGYIMAKNFTPIYDIKFGYGIGIINPTIHFKTNITKNYKVEGKAMFHPSLGIRFDGDSKNNFYVALGFRFQRMIYFADVDEGTQIRQTDIKYQRITFTTGIAFKNKTLFQNEIIFECPICFDIHFVNERAGIYL